MSQISSDLATQNALRNPTNGFNAMSSEEFMKIIFTELSHQDPFAPSDSSALLNQLSTIRSIESDVQLMDRLTSLVTENQLAAGSSMIGKFVGGLTEEHDRVAGTVVAVIREGDKISLELDSGWVLPLSNVESVIDQALDNPDNTGGSTTTPTTPPPVTDTEEDDEP
jgi:flagellar basal-body rod modification protein FlgD